MDKSLQHLIAADFVQVALALGRTPSLKEYLATGQYTVEQIENNFGSFIVLCQSTGLEVAAAKINKQEIRKKYFDYLLQEIEARRQNQRTQKIIKRLLNISDMHEPYGHQDTDQFLFALDDKYGFDHILIGGDEADYHAMSFHDSDPNLPAAGYELEAAIEKLQPRYDRFKEADVLSSNHGDMVYRKGKHHGFPRQVLKPYNEVMRAPDGWQWREMYTYTLSNGQKLYTCHGVSKNYLSAAQQLGMNFVQFHYHNELGVRYWAVNGNLYFAIQSGCLVDDTSLAMAYNKATLGRPVIGCSGVIDGIPRLFPMILDQHGRWTGVVP